MEFSESQKETQEYKAQYLREIHKIIEQRRKAAQKIRLEHHRELFTNASKYRKKIRHIFGWPLTEYERGVPVEAKMHLLVDGEKHIIYRIQIEILPGLNLTGLFFEQKKKKGSLVIAQHGGLGTPELVSGFYGDTENYNGMISRILKYDCSVFVPQLLLWSKNNYGVDYDRQIIDAQLKAVGSSITAVELYGVIRAIDYFGTKGYERFGMVGLSYGGFYTLLAAALDTRIRSAISCSYFNSYIGRDGFPDWYWFESDLTFKDAELACLVYPRKLCIQVGTEDELFNIKGARAEYKCLLEYTKPVGTDWLRFVEFEGIHEFFKDDTYIRQLVEDISS